MPTRQVPTPLLSADGLAREYDLDSILLKLESSLPCGTHKSRAAQAVVRAAQAKGYRSVTAGTCGNYGAALSTFAEEAGMRCTIYIPADYHTERDLQIRGHGASVQTVRGGYEDAVAASRAYAIEAGAYDSNPGGIADSDILMAFSQIADELLDQLGSHDVTDVWLPIGNGTTVAGLHRGFKRNQVAPALHVVGSLGNTAAVSGVWAGRPVTLRPADIRPTATNEPLCNWDSFHAAEAILAVNESRGSAHAVSDAQLQAAAASVNQAHGLRATPAGVAGLAALADSHDRRGKPGRHVIIVTAAEVFAP